MRSRHRTCQASSTSPHRTASSASWTRAGRSDSLLSSHPASSLGLEVRSTRVSRRTRYRAALDPRSQPRLPARRTHAAQPVRYRHVRHGDTREQGYVGGPALMRAPLPDEHLPAVPVDRDDQAPAVHHVRAVRHHRVVLRRHGRRRGALSSTSTGGTAPTCSKIPSSPTAHALRVLPGQRHRVPHVRIRKRRHQAVHVRPAPRHHGLRQTEIRLHHARRPLQPPDTRHREADAPASSASRTAARSGTNHRTPAPRPACHTRAWPYAAACAA